MKMIKFGEFNYFNVDDIRRIYLSDECEGLTINIAFNKENEEPGLISLGGFDNIKRIENIVNNLLDIIDADVITVDEIVYGWENNDKYDKYSK